MNYYFLDSAPVMSRRDWASFFPESITPICECKLAQEGSEIVIISTESDSAINNSVLFIHLTPMGVSESIMIVECSKKQHTYIVFLSGSGVVRNQYENFTHIYCRRTPLLQQPDKHFISCVKNLNQALDRGMTFSDACKFLDPQVTDMLVALNWLFIEVCNNEGEIAPVQWMEDYWDSVFHENQWEKEIIHELKSLGEGDYCGVIQVAAEKLIQSKGKLIETTDILIFRKSIEIINQILERTIFIILLSHMEL